MLFQKSHPARRTLSRMALPALSVALCCGMVLPAAAQENLPPSQLRIFHLNNIANTDEANDVARTLRNMLDPRDRVYLHNERNDLFVYATPEQLDLAARMLADLDKPRKTYRLTFTITESEEGKRVGVQHFSMVALSGQRVQLKQGDKVPVLTGSYDAEKSAAQTQFTYLDVGMNFDAQVDEFGSGLRLRSKVEQSSVAAAPQNAKTADDPIVRQSVLEGTSTVVPGKPRILGSMDVVGSAQHMEIEVVTEPID